MTKKRILSFLLIIAMIVSVITGCHSSRGIVNPLDAPSSNSVYDASNDSGKLSVRYLGLKSVHITDADKINVGDCAVYKSPEGLVMMIDCSNRNCFAEIDDCLNKMGIDKIDVFVMSHPHADHIGAFAGLARKYQIGQVYKNSHVYDSEAYREAMDCIYELKIPCSILNEGDSFMFGTDVKVEVFNPPAESQDFAQTSISAANDCSLAMKITYGKSSFWTSGDLYQDREINLVNHYGDALDCDVMKINHHGYETSNSKAFIAAVSPKVAVSMHESITSQPIAMLYALKFKALTFYTCQDGTVLVSTPGDGTYEVICETLREKTFYGIPAKNCHYIVK